MRVLIVTEFGQAYNVINLEQMVDRSKQAAQKTPMDNAKGSTPRLSSYFILDPLQQLRGNHGVLRKVHHFVQARSSANYIPPNAAANSLYLERTMTGDDSVSRPMPESLRRFFARRFSYDFRSVRIHSDVAAGIEAQANHALAFTRGHDIYFAAGEYAPDTFAGRNLLAHELTHVIQQNQDHCPLAMSNNSLESEATHVQHEISRGQDVLVRNCAPEWQRQFRRVEHPPSSGRFWEVGDISLDDRVAQDITANALFTSDRDRAHIIAYPGGDRRFLGYAVSHTDPFDVVRWERMTEIVNGSDTHLDIHAIDTDTQIPHKIVSGGAEISERATLSSLGGVDTRGLTLVRRSLYERLHAGTISGPFQHPGLDPFYTLVPHEWLRFIASSNDSRDQIYYIFGSNSLAHEFFGHIWLALRGVPFGHPPTVEELQQRGRSLTEDERRLATRRLQVLGSLGQQHVITDPFGQTFSGTVREFIDRTAGAEGTRRGSPTLGVGPSYLARYYRDFHDAVMAGGISLVSTQPPDIQVSPRVVTSWAWLAQNYAVSVRGWGSQRHRTPAARRILELVTNFYFRELSVEKQIAFDTFLHRRSGSDISVIPIAESNYRDFSSEVVRAIQLRRSTGP